VSRAILQVSIAVFRALSKTFSGKGDSAPPLLEKIGPHAYAEVMAGVSSGSLAVLCE